VRSFFLSILIIINENKNVYCVVKSCVVFYIDTNNQGEIPMKRIIRGVLSVVIIGSIGATYAAESIKAPAKAPTKAAEKAPVKEKKRIFPLKVDIDVSTKRINKTIGDGNHGDAKVKWVSCRVKIRKSSGEPYSDKLKVELYIIGRQIHTDYYGIVDIVKKDFTLTKENKNIFEFTTKKYPIGRTSGNINVGGVYETYLVVIVDKDGKIVDTRSGRIIKEKGIAFIRELGPKTLFDRDGNVVGKVNMKNTAFKRAIPAAVSGND